jgi:hypothetical protein
MQSVWYLFPQLPCKGGDSWIKAETLLVSAACHTERFLLIISRTQAKHFSIQNHFLSVHGSASLYLVLVFFFRLYTYVGAKSLFLNVCLVQCNKHLHLYISDGVQVQRMNPCNGCWVSEVASACSLQVSWALWFIWQFSWICCFCCLGGRTCLHHSLDFTVKLIENDKFCVLLEPKKDMKGHKCAAIPTLYSRSEKWGGGLLEYMWIAHLSLSA